MRCRFAIQQPNRQSNSNPPFPVENTSTFMVDVPTGHVKLLRFGTYFVIVLMTSKMTMSLCKIMFSQFSHVLSSLASTSDCPVAATIAGPRLVEWPRHAGSDRCLRLRNGEMLIGWIDMLRIFFNLTSKETTHRKHHGTFLRRNWKHFAAGGTAGGNESGQLRGRVLGLVRKNMRMRTVNFNERAFNKKTSLSNKKVHSAQVTWLEDGSWMKNQHVLLKVKGFSSHK